jgi:hypothetical protein
MYVTSWSEYLNFSTCPNRFTGIHTLSRMHNKTMIVVGCLRGDIGTVYLPFRYGGWLEVPTSTVRYLTYSSGRPMTSSTIPSCGSSDMVVCDLSSATVSLWFGAIPFILKASLGFSGCTRFPASSTYWPCPSSSVSMSIHVGVVFWVSSTMGVGLPSVISGDEISFMLTNSGG